MQRYIVDLRSIPLKDRPEVLQRLDNGSFFAVGIYESNILVGADVYWDSENAFQTSPVYPTGCPCKEYGS